MGKELGPHMQAQKNAQGSILMLHISSAARLGTEQSM